MKFVDLKKNLTEKIFNCYVVAGEDAYLRMSAQNLIKANTVTDFVEMNISYVSPDTPISQMIDCFNTLPLMSPFKLIIVRDFEPQGDDAKKQIMDYFANPNPLSVVLFITKSDFLRKLPDLYPQSSVFVDCAHMDTYTIKKWLAREFSRLNLEIQPNAADLLCSFCGYDMTRLSSETQKLTAIGKSVVCVQDIEDLVVPENAFQLYELSNAVSQRNADKSLTILQTLLHKNDLTYLLQTIYNHFRRMFYASVSTESNAALAQKLGVKEYAIKKTRESLSLYRPARLKKILDIIYKTETMVKSGKMKALDALYYTILKII